MLPCISAEQKVMPFFF